MSNEKMEEPWVPELGEFVRVMHDAGYRRVPPFEHDHDDDCWEGTEGPVYAVDEEDGTAVVYCFRRDAEGSFPIADLTPLDHLKRPEGAVDGAWVQIETGKYDGMLAQIRGWHRGKLHIRRAGGPVEAYRPEEVALLGNPGVNLDISRATPPVGLRGGEPSGQQGMTVQPTRCDGPQSLFCYNIPVSGEERRRQYELRAFPQGEEGLHLDNTCRVHGYRFGGPWCLSQDPLNQFKCREVLFVSYERDLVREKK